MIERMKNVFMGVGALSCIYSLVLYFTAPLNLQAGLMLNILVFVFDCLYFLCIGIFFLRIGLLIHRGKLATVVPLKVGVYLLIFSVVFVGCSVLFNLMTKPFINSTGRILAFLLQSLGRLTAPSFSADFLVPFIGLLSFIVLSIAFKRFLLPTLTGEIERLNEKPGAR